MKYYTFALTIMSIVFFCDNVFSQTNDRTKRVDHSIENNFIEYSIPVVSDGEYSIILMDPSGSVISWPVKNEKFSNGANISFTLNSKYWRSGEYRLQLMQHERPVDMYTINVGLSKREMARLRKGPK